MQGDDRDRNSNCFLFYKGKRGSGAQRGYWGAGHRARQTFNRRPPTPLRVKDVKIAMIRNFQ
jgi:hypothetical protein